MKLVLLSACLAALAACSATRPVEPNALLARSNGAVDFTPNSPAERSNGPAIVFQFRDGSAAEVLADWRESRRRLRFARGCILLPSAGEQRALHAEAPFFRTYPLGDDRDLDLALVELSPSTTSGEIRVTSPLDRDPAVERVIRWLKERGGSVVAPHLDE